MDIEAIRARLTANPRAIRPEDVHVLLAEVERLCAKNTELNRRATKAEAFGLSFGRALANVAADTAGRRAEEAEGKLAQVRAVHEPFDALNVRYGHVQKVCAGCGTDDGNWQVWPCPTIRAIGEAE